LLRCPGSAPLGEGIFKWHKSTLEVTDGLLVVLGAVAQAPVLAY